MSKGFLTKWFKGPSKTPALKTVVISRVPLNKTFKDVLMPDGSQVLMMDRHAHEAGLRAAERSLRRLMRV